MAPLGRIGRRRTPGGEVRYYLDFRSEARSHGLRTDQARIYAVKDRIGTSPLYSPRHAQDWLSYVNARVADGEPLFAAIERIRPQGRVDVLPLATQWLDRQQNRADAGSISPASLETMQSHVRRYWPHWQNVAVHDVTRAAMDDWRDELLARGLAPSTVRQVVGYLHAFLSWLHDRRIVNHLPKMPSVHVQKVPKSLLTFGEQDAVLAQIRPELRGVFLAGTDLMLRSNESRALRPADFRLEGDRGWVTVSRGFKGHSSRAPIRGTKTGEFRILPLTLRLRAWLEEHLAGEARLRTFAFPRPAGGAWGYKQMRFEWAAASKRAGVQYVAVQKACRNSTATELRRLGLGEDVIDQFLGHGRNRMRAAYIELEPKLLLPLVEARDSAAGSARTVVPMETWSG